MAEAHLDVVAIVEGGGGIVCVTARRVFVRVVELCDDGQGDFLAACEPFGDKARVPRLHVHRGPYPGIGQEGRSPVPTDVGKVDDLFGVFFGVVINGEIENSCQKF